MTPEQAVKTTSANIAAGKLIPLSTVIQKDVKVLIMSKAREIIKGDRMLGYDGVNEKRPVVGARKVETIRIYIYEWICPNCDLKNKSEDFEVFCGGCNLDVSLDVEQPENTRAGGTGDRYTVDEIIKLDVWWNNHDPDYETFSDWLRDNGHKAREIIK
jgi:hypothetical protein